MKKTVNGENGNTFAIKIQCVQIGQHVNKIYLFDTKMAAQ